MYNLLQITRAVFLLGTVWVLTLQANGYREYEYKYNYEITPVVGMIQSEDKLYIGDESSAGLRLQFNNYGIFKPEFSIDHSSGSVEYDINGSTETEITRLTFNEVYELETSSILQPYVLTGIGLEVFSDEAGENLDDFYFNYGAGIKYNLFSSDYALKIEAKHIITLDGLDQRYGIYAGVSIPVGKTYKYRDSDEDGVYDIADSCPDTPENVSVDSQGCPLDGDKDGVFDVFDRCPDTPAGNIVNSEGCQLDSDMDGVIDLNDSCPDTPYKILVDTAGCPLDSDKDGVWDTNDSCPGTPQNVTVDIKGCPLDEDMDGVWDINDSCPGTPHKVLVDTAGCPLDSDRDGVWDSNDSCEYTPFGVKVDKEGCPMDKDNDGVKDEDDKCPNTPRGIKVDKDGCPYDDDKDGVWNINDRCPNTPLGFQVDKFGCITTKQLAINFLSGSSDFASAQSSAEIEGFAEFLKVNPFIIVIEGHTSAGGNAEKNYFLSLARSERVRAELINLGIDKKRIHTIGLGESMPVVSNSTREGRIKNRRITVKLFKTQKEALEHIATAQSKAGESLISEYIEKLVK